MAQVNFRVDDTVKARTEDACAAMGLTENFGRESPRLNPWVFSLWNGYKIF